MDSELAVLAHVAVNEITGKPLKVIKATNQGKIKLTLSFQWPDGNDPPPTNIKQKLDVILNDRWQKPSSSIEVRACTYREKKSTLDVILVILDKPAAPPTPTATPRYEFRPSNVFQYTDKIMTVVNSNKDEERVKEEIANLLVQFKNEVYTSLFSSINDL